jgi:hypothetical protein
LDKLVKKLNINKETCETIINHLLQEKLLVRTADQPAALIPGYAIETITLKNVISSARKAGETTAFSIDSIPGDQVVDHIYADIEESVYSKLDSKTLYDMSVNNN